MARKHFLEIGKIKMYEKKIRCFQWVDTNEYIYLVSPEHNGIFRVDKATHDAYLEMSVDDCTMFEGGQYTAITRIDEKLFCIPGEADRILMYDIRTKNKQYFVMHNIPEDYQFFLLKENKFFYTYVFENILLLFGAQFPAIIYLDVATGKMEYISGILEIIKKISSKPSTQFYFSGGYIRKENYLYVPIEHMNAVLRLDLKQKRANYFSPEGGMDGYEGIVQAENKIYLLGRKEDLYYLLAWDPKTNQVYQIKIPNEVRPQIYWSPFWPPIYYRGKLYLIPVTASHFYIMDILEQKIRIATELDKMLQNFPKNGKEMKVIAVRLSGCTLTIITYFDYKWHTIDLETGEQSEYIVEIKDENYWRMYKRDVCRRKFELPGIILEDELILLNFLDAVIKYKNIIKEQ